MDGMKKCWMTRLCIFVSVTVQFSTLSTSPSVAADANICTIPELKFKKKNILRIRLYYTPPSIIGKWPKTCQNLPTRQPTEGWWVGVLGVGVGRAWGSENSYPDPDPSVPYLQPVWVSKPVLIPTLLMLQWLCLTAQHVLPLCLPFILLITYSWHLGWFLM